MVWLCVLGILKCLKGGVSKTRNGVTGNGVTRNRVTVFFFFFFFPSVKKIVNIIISRVWRGFLLRWPTSITAKVCEHHGKSF